MAKPIFNKKIHKACKYCEHSSPSSFNDEMICRHKGVTEPDDHCLKYRYDPFKRVPAKQTLDKNYTKEDFSID
ncbi:MAG: hypothetical protein IJX79_00160 [Clostridia bacterium]|nr:hypothetical protein [Clostridia bacterium]